MRQQQRTKWQTQRSSLEVGDLVMIADDNLVPQCWRTGRVHRLKPGRDGLVRIVEVRTSEMTAEGRISHRFVDRAIHRLAKLPINRRGENVQKI